MRYKTKSKASFSVKNLVYAVLVLSLVMVLVPVYAQTPTLEPPFLLHGTIQQFEHGKML